MRIKDGFQLASSVRMNDFWDRMKRELRDAIRESGRPELARDSFRCDRLGFDVRVAIGGYCVQSQYSLALVLQRRVARFPTSPG